MRPSLSAVRALSAFLLIAAVSVPAAVAQDGPPPYVRRAVDAVVAMLDGDDDASIAEFVASAMVPAADRDAAELTARLRTIREALRGLRDDIAVEAEPDGVRLILGDGDRERQLRVVLGPEGISDLVLLDATERPAGLVLTRDNLSSTFDRLEREGFSGVVYVRLGGTVVLDRAFGMANAELGIPVGPDTVFGVGSRPIDFTKASIYLLEQRGRLDQDDTIGEYFDGVPADRKSMTIRHLMTGQSGLPDFPGTEADWDQDLAWIDRAELERRLLGVPLLFAPGSDRRHSHAAFGLLAALIERVSGQGYEAFIREHFLEPAGMDRTGMYGDARGLALADFAVGGGPSRVGLPNIPPNWGPTSWLVMGSGGMYSTVPDLRRFYDLVRSDRVLEERYARTFRGGFFSLDGSERGFELFQACVSPDDEAYLMVNLPGRRDDVRAVIRALERLVEPRR